jgi:hypothetical protein
MGKFACSPTPGEPVAVSLTVWVEDIRNIDAKTSTASMMIQFGYQWVDPRLVKACREDSQFVLPDDLWKPGLKMVNGIAEAQTTLDSVPDVRIVDANKGEVFQCFVFAGEVDNPMDLDNFPFDEDAVDIRLSGCRMRNGRAASASDFILRAHEGPKFVTFFFERHLPEFELLGVSYVEYIDIWKNSCVTFGIHIRRKHWYYFYKVTVLMWLIVLLSMPTFLFGFEELEQRMALTATMFLATAATLYVVGQDLPKTEELNKMDKLLLGTLAMIFATGAESIAVFLLHKTDEAAAQRLEDFVAVSLPAAYSLLNIVLFGWPAVRLCWFQGSHPTKIRKERAFIPWNEVCKVDPWGADSRSQILTEGKEHCGFTAMEVDGTRKGLRTMV